MQEQDKEIAGVNITRLMRNLEETSYNEGSEALACRLSDCREVIKELISRIEQQAARISVLEAFCNEQGNTITSLRLALDARPTPAVDLSGLTRYEPGLLGGKMHVIDASEVGLNPDSEFIKFTDLQKLLSSPVVGEGVMTDSTAEVGSCMPPFAAPAGQHDAGVRDFLQQLANCEGGMVNGNRLAQRAKELIGELPATEAREKISSFENDLKFWRLLDESQRAAARNKDELNNANRALIAYLDSVLAQPDAESVRQIHLWMDRATRAEEAFASSKFDLDAYERLCQGKDAEAGKIDRYARSLAMGMWNHHYREESPRFELLEDTYGVLSQIDNMLTGLGRVPDAPSTPSQAWNGELPELPEWLTRGDKGRLVPRSQVCEFIPDYARKAIGAAVAGVREQALEEAAKVVDALGDAKFDGDKLDAAIECFDAIRSIRSNPVSLREKAEVPEGYQLVPIKETPAMVEAYINTRNTGFAGSPAPASHVWEAMLAAAPHPASNGNGEKGGDRG